jgi:hypothetical protein
MPNSQLLMISGKAHGSGMGKWVNRTNQGLKFFE